VANDTPITAHRAERTLAFMIASSVGLSILCIVAVIVGTAVGVKNFGEGAWPVVIVLPGIGLVIGLVLIVALLVVSSVRRGREAKDARK
jgi:uncharacterized integral membrane protein